MTTACPSILPFQFIIYNIFSINSSSSSDIINLKTRILSHSNCLKQKKGKQKEVKKRSVKLLLFLIRMTALSKRLKEIWIMAFWWDKWQQNWTEEGKRKDKNWFFGGFYGEWDEYWRIRGWWLRWGKSFGGFEGPWKFFGDICDSINF